MPRSSARSSMEGTVVPRRPSGRRGLLPGPDDTRKKPSFHGGLLPERGLPHSRRPFPGIALTPAYFLSRLKSGRSGPPP